LRIWSLFLVLRDIDDADADRFVADGFEVGEAFEGGGDFILFVRMSGNNDGDGGVGAGDFVLEDARNADGVVGEDFANLGEDAGLVLDHKADVEPADEVIDFVNHSRYFGVRFEIEIFEGGRGIAEGDFDNVCDKKAVRLSEVTCDAEARRVYDKPQSAEGENSPKGGED
jgi:hypothetical protein